MSARVSLSRKDALELLSFVADLDGNAAVNRLRAALKARPKKVAARKEKRQGVAKTKADKRDETAEIRAAILARAGGECEYCGAVATAHNPLELDHMFGRIRLPQSTQSCWMLCRLCHRAKTSGDPTAASWFWRFAGHCTKHDYFAEYNLAAKNAEWAIAKSALRGTA